MSADELPKCPSCGKGKAVFRFTRMKALDPKTDEVLGENSPAIFIRCTRCRFQSMPLNYNPADRDDITRIKIAFAKWWLTNCESDDLLNSHREKKGKRDGIVQEKS